MRRVIGTIALAGAMLAGVSAAPPAQAATIEVAPGQSIQAAINAANPGDAIVVQAGVYRESLIIRKDGIKLLGAGDDTSGTVLVPPTQTNSFCAEGSSFPGICVLAKKLDPNTFDVVTPVSNVLVDGFLVRNFPGDGIVTYGASKTTFLDNTAVNNEGYGITSFVSTGNVYDRLVARGNGGPGFYIGDSDDADFSLTNSVAVGNAMGILVREANNGTLANNVFRENCAGIVLFNHGGPPGQDVRVRSWSIYDNQLLQNNKNCPSGDGPAFSGTGILIGGAASVNFTNNVVRGNQPVVANAYAGGIVLASTVSDGGAAPVNNTVRSNTALNNAPFDIRYDRTGTGNTFPGNTCGRSTPAWICS